MDRASMRLRFPAEWEPQDAVLIAWPHAGTDWAAQLAEVETTYVALGLAVTRFQHLVVVVANAALETRARQLLGAAGADLARLRFVEATYDDTWLRDSGPITLRDGQGFCLLDFRFTGWGGKYGAAQDDALVSRLVAAGLFKNARHQRVDFALEGGAIETDGTGTLLSTWRCLHERHPGLTRQEIGWQLENTLQQHRVLWLEHGALEGDDTDAHIDTLARFAAGDAIVYQSCDDPADTHYPELQAMAAELAALRTTENRPYRLYPLPWARPIIDGGRRLAASYANFLIINGAVLMPTYGDPKDAAAAVSLGNAFPNHRIVPVPCRALIGQNGSLHCITMQLPEGVLA
ncbi:agmatine deiminase family protein [Silanimonas sp.]|uniref:agmatine deiminase family protein n=1 Tax=Silanimonas sp. TaxID=1929290 RepID=UPI001BC4BB2A|nr:agmatine deiminase family protein [Silanimonas sp.]MBS3896683.1 agmatine deiminase family protein [Silanimonas sp.]MBS3924544.1 agmatine deiminase family protein [Xanthomonadaceae bacterium]